MIPGGIVHGAEAEGCIYECIVFSPSLLYVSSGCRSIVKTSVKESVFYTNNPVIDKIFDLLRKTKLFKPVVEKLEAKAMGKSDKIKKAEFWGLVLFVGIPLPGTGAWTGSLIASLLKIRRKKASVAIFLGILLATVIMCVVSYLIPWFITQF